MSGPSSNLSAQSTARSQVAMMEVATGPVWLVHVADGPQLVSGAQTLELITPNGPATVNVTPTPFPERTAMAVTDQVRAALARTLPEATCHRDGSRVVVRGGSQGILRVSSRSRAWRVRELVTGPALKLEANVRETSAGLHMAALDPQVASVLRWTHPVGARAILDGRPFVVDEVTFHGDLLLAPLEIQGGRAC